MDSAKCSGLSIYGDLEIPEHIGMVTHNSLKCLFGYGVGAFFKKKAPTPISQERANFPREY